MIPCPKCGAQNQIGAIFCRSCGEKLNLEELSPETVKAAAKKQVGRSFNLFAWIKNLIMLGILAAVVGILVGLFLEPTMPEIELTDTVRRTALSKKRQYEQGLTQTLVLNEAEVNAIAEDIFELTPKGIEKAKEEFLAEGASGMIPIGVTVDLLDNNRVRIILKQQHVKHEKIRYFSIIEGKVSVDGGKINFVPEKAWQGKVPLDVLEFTYDIVKERFKDFYIKNQVFLQFINSIRGISISEDKVTITGQMSGNYGPREDAPGGETGTRRRRR